MKITATRFVDDEHAPLRVLCFPYAGGRSQSLCSDLARAVRAQNQAATVEIIGVDWEMEEGDSMSVAAWTDALLLALKGQFFDKKFVVFGHSLGALAALAFTRLLSDRGLPLPEHVFLSGIAAPSHWKAYGNMDHEDDTLVRMLTRWNGTDPALLEDAARKVSATKKLRVDLLLHDLLVEWLLQPHGNEEELVLHTATTVYGGDADPDVPLEALHLWTQVQTSLPAPKTCVFAGDHFFLTSSDSQPLVHAALLEELTHVTTRVLLSSAALIDTWNSASAPYPEDKCLQELFQEAVTRSPNAIAICYQDKTLTFQQLDTQSDTLANYLFTIGVRPNSICGIFMEHSIEFVIAYIASLKAGGAYMPLEIVYPPDLLERVMEEAKPTIILTKRSFRGRLPKWQLALELDNGWLLDLQGIPPMPLDRIRTKPDDLAYVVMSSGTTGVPKGICCPHRGAVHSYHWRLVNCPYIENDRVASHVFFVWELLRPLLGNMPLYIIPDDAIYDPIRLVSYLHDHQITRILFTPSLLQLILDTVPREQLISKLVTLRLVWLCGEVVTIELRDRFVSLFPKCELQNLYSVSECHDVSAVDLAHPSSELDSLLSSKYASCGSLMDNVRAYVLDDQHKPVALGVPGELYVGGPCLARGYLNREEQTSQRFLTSIEATGGQRVYRTGDRARFLPNGHLELIGRCDFMVKIRGYSVVLGAVEAALAQHPLVSTAVVLTEGDEGQDKRLVAYIVPETWDKTPSVFTLREFVKTKLPHYAIPSVFVQLDALPINSASGKLDRKKIPSSQDQTAKKLRLASIDLTYGSSSSSDGGTSRSSKPQTETEQRLSTLWMDLLRLQDSNMEVVDRQANFFDLGGHSLLATRLVSSIRDEFNAHLTLADILSDSTLCGLAATIDDSITTSGGSSTTSTNEGPPVQNTKTKKVVFPLEAASLDPSIYPAATRKSGYSRYRVEMASKPPHAVLLTGCTGFLGAHLLHELLVGSDTVVYCLVRGDPAAGDVDAAMALRLERILRSFGLWDAVVSNGYDERVVLLAGDLAKPLLGLGEPTFKMLATEIDAILHNGAEVNLVKPYASLKPVNVLGTQEVLRLAVTNGLMKTRVKPVHYISTNGVFPGSFPDDRLMETSDLSELSDALDNGYAQSKWVAEQMCHVAAQRGLPVAILRPGNMAPSSSTGVWNPHDFMFLLLQGCSKVGAVPQVPQWWFDLTPVDFAAKAIVHFSVRHPIQALGQTLHIQNPLRAVPGDAFMDMWRGAIGGKMEMVPLETWRQKVRELSEQKQDQDQDVELQQLAAGIEAFEMYLESAKVFDSSLATGLLNGAGIHCPVVDEKLLAQYGAAWK